MSSGLLYFTGAEGVCQFFPVDFGGVYKAGTAFLGNIIAKRAALPYLDKFRQM